MIYETEEFERPDPDLERFKDIPALLGKRMADYSRTVLVKVGEGSTIPASISIEPSIDCCRRSIVERGGNFCRECGTQHNWGERISPEPPKNESVFAGLGAIWPLFFAAMLGVLATIASHGIITVLK